MAKAALDKAYRRDLAAWVASAEPSSRAAQQADEKRIHAYLTKTPEAEGRLIDLSRLDLSILPPLRADLKALDASRTKLIALPKNLPQGLQTLDVSFTELSVLPENLPQGLLTLSITHTKLIALPENLPQGLQTLDVSYTELSALPENLPQGMLTPNVRHTDLSALPENLPDGLHTLDVRNTELTSAASLTLMQTNTSITTLVYINYDAFSIRKIEHELENNRERPARLANAAVSLDLLTRLAFTTSDRTDRQTR